MSQPKVSAPVRKRPPAARDAQATPRVIKKYPNRRLYDTESSTYITRAKVRELVMAHKPFVEREARSE